MTKECGGGKVCLVKGRKGRKRREKRNEKLNEI
jgi:hypothetical protein